MICKGCKLVACIVCRGDEEVMEYSCLMFTAFNTSQCCPGCEGPDEVSV